MARPSSSTAPAVGRSSRPSARSRVDLPQPLGPTIAVNEPSVSCEVEVVDDDAVAVGEPDVLGGEPHRPAFGRGVSSSGHRVDRRLPRTRSQSRYGAPTTAVTMPTGSAVGQHGAGDQVARRRQHGAEQAGGEQRRPGAAGEPDGDLRDDERDEGDRPGRGRRRRRPARRRPARPPPAPPAAARRGRGRCRRRTGGRASTRPAASASGHAARPARAASGQGLVPGAAVERAGDPDVGRGGVVDVGAGEQAVDQRRAIADSPMPTSTSR